MAGQAAEMTESLRRTSPPKSAAPAGVETNASAVRPFRVSVPDSELAEPWRDRGGRNMSEQQIVDSSQ